MSDSNNVKGVKLNPRKSRFAQESSAKDDFEKMVNEAVEKKEGYQQMAFDLGKEFLGLMKDKTLPENKGPIAANLEKEVLNKLINFSIMVNTDQNEPEGMGSIGLVTLLLKTSLVFRDNYNRLEYNYELINKKSETLQKRIEELENKLSSR